MKKFLFIILLIPVSVFSQDFKFRWEQVSGPVKAVIVDPDSAATLVTGLDIAGEYLFEFSVTNMFGTGKDTCKVTVLPPDVLAIDTSSKIIIRREPVKKFSAQALVKGDLIYIQIKSPKTQKVRVVLYNVMGQALAHADIPVKSGENILTLPKPRASGLYILRFFNEITNYNYKIAI